MTLDVFNGWLGNNDIRKAREKEEIGIRSIPLT